MVWCNVVNEFTSHPTSYDHRKLMLTNQFRFIPFPDSTERSLTWWKRDACFVLMASFVPRTLGKLLWRWSHSRLACSASTKAAPAQAVIHWWPASRQWSHCAMDGGSRATASKLNTLPLMWFSWRLCAAPRCSTATTNSAISTNSARSTSWVS